MLTSFLTIFLTLLSSGQDLLSSSGGQTPLWCHGFMGTQSMCCTLGTSWPLGLFQPFHSWGSSPHAAEGPTPFWVTVHIHTHPHHRGLQENTASCRAVSASSQKLTEALLHSSGHFPIAQNCRTQERNAQWGAQNSSLKTGHTEDSDLTEKQKQLCNLKKPKCPWVTKGREGWAIQALNEVYLKMRRPNDNS